jgi:hypothetical protein
MKQHLAGVGKHFVAAVLLAVAVAGVSTFTIRTPSEKSAARSLDSIQTDKTTLFYADRIPYANWFVEQVMAGTSESKEAKENLRLVAATL